MTADDGLPGITLVKEANVTTILEGTPTDVTYCYTLTSQSAATDPLTITSLVDDNGRPLPGADTDQIKWCRPVASARNSLQKRRREQQRLLDGGETWLFNYTVEDVVLNTRELGRTLRRSPRRTTRTYRSDDDNAVVTGEDVLPDVNIEKSLR